VLSFLDFADFFITDGDYLSEFLKDAEVISDDKPLLEFSDASLLPPMRWETDESFLNMLHHRIDQKPPVQGLSDKEQDIFNSNFQLRTAQRLSVFSQRYQGPGMEFFAAKSYMKGLKVMDVYFKTHKNTSLHLDDARWPK